MSNLARYPYTSFVDDSGSKLLRPMVPISLGDGGQLVGINALLDSGADANVLPYRLGLTVGADWNAARLVAPLSGNLGNVEARAIVLSLVVSRFDPVRMVFIWVKTDMARLLLGQINFFQEFDVCFYGSAEHFEIRPKS